MPGTRRKMLRQLTSTPLAVLLATGVDESTLARDRVSHRHRTRHQHVESQHGPSRSNRDAHGEACIPTGQRCPSRKPRGKKAKKLSCHRCCQGASTTDTNGKRICTCQPNGAACTGQSAAFCCSGSCLDGVCSKPICPPCSGTTPICQGNPCVACTSPSQCPAGQICLLDGSCQACD